MIPNLMPQPGNFIHHLKIQTPRDDSKIKSATYTKPGLDPGEFESIARSEIDIVSQDEGTVLRMGSKFRKTKKAIIKMVKNIDERTEG
jgi:hypothetical protein